MYTLIELPVFSRYRSNYFSDDEFAERQKHICANPQAGDAIPGSQGVRKLRWSRAGVGKQGGARVL